MSNVTPLHPNAIENEIGDLLGEAATMALITVGKDFKPSFLLPHTVPHGMLPHLICALRDCLYELEDRRFSGGVD